MQHCGSFKLRLYEHYDMEGEMMELVDECPNLMDRFRICNFNSCDVMDGYWLIYEQPNYRGRHYYLKLGLYRSFSEWSGTNSKVGSIRRLVGV